MKVYYREDDLYPATYNFKDEADGTNNIDIEFIYSVSGQGTDCKSEIVALIGGHKKVLQFHDNNGAGRVVAYHGLSGSGGIVGNQEYGTIEFFIRTTDATKRTQLYFYDGSNIVFIFQIDVDKFQYNDGGVQDVGLACLDNIWYHIRIDFECTGGTYQGLAQYDWHLYIDGIHYGDYDFVNNQAHIDKVTFFTDTADSGYSTYIDAFGESWDTDYNIGDNREVKFHDPYNKEEITNIIKYPDPKVILNATSICSCSVADYEGALITTWEEYDDIPMIVEDDASNIIFRGFLSKKTFTAKAMHLEMRGLSTKLEWGDFTRNYILAEGLVSSVPSTTGVAGQTFNLRCDADVDVNWSVPIAGNHFEEIDDPIASPDGDTTMIAADSTDDGLVETFSFENITTSGITNITGVMFYVYGRNNATLGNAVMEVDIKFASTAFGDDVQKEMNFTSSYAWHTPSWTGLTKSEAEINGLQIRFTALVPLAANEEQRISSVYAVITYTGSKPSYIDLTNSEGDPFTWETDYGTDYWINDQDVGILIVDNSQNINSKTWVSSALTAANGANAAGNNASTTAKGDADHYHYEDSGIHDATIDLTIDVGDDIADSNTLQRIDIHYKFDATQLSDFSRIDFLADKDGAYDYTLKTFRFGSSIGEETFFFEGVIPINDTDAELAKFLTKTGANYDTFEGFRIFYNGGTGTVKLDVDYIAVEIFYHEHDISPFMDKIDDHGESWLECDGVVFEDTGVDVGDDFKIGQNTNKILSDIASDCSIEISIISTLSKYMARWFRGSNGFAALKAVCLLEGLDWKEDSINNRIVLAREADFPDTGVDLDSTDYDPDWEYEDDCNHYYKVKVYGNASYPVYAEAIDNTIDSERVKIIIDETIMTDSDAKEIADAQLLIYKVKRPSIKLTLHGVQSSLEVGKKVHITLEEPDGTDIIAQAFYPIRMIERSRRGIEEIRTIIYAGLGHTSADEFIAKTIRDIAYLANKAHTDRLVSTPFSGSGSITWGDVGGGTAAVQTLSINNVVEDTTPEIISTTSIPIKPSGDIDDYIYLFTDSNIPYVGLVGGVIVYFRTAVAGSWITIHAAGVTEHTSPLPIELSTDKILNIKNNAKGALIYDSLPKDVKDEGGMKLGTMVMYLVKTIQELGQRIKKLEEVKMDG